MKRSLVFGDVRVFAVEACVTDQPLFAMVRIWAGGTSFGDFSQISVLRALQATAAEFLLAASGEMPLPPPEDADAEAVRKWRTALGSDEYWDSDQRARDADRTIRACSLFPFVSEGLAAVRVVVLGHGEECLVTVWDVRSESTVQVRASSGVVRDAVRQFVEWAPSEYAAP